jgi:hypothetical protein
MQGGRNGGHCNICEDPGGHNLKFCKIQAEHKNIKMSLIKVGKRRTRGGERGGGKRTAGTARGLSKSFFIRRGILAKTWVRGRSLSEMGILTNLNLHYCRLDSDVMNFSTTSTYSTVMSQTPAVQAGLLREYYLLIVRCTVVRVKAGVQ